MGQVQIWWQWFREHDVDSVVIVVSGILMSVLGVLGIASSQVITSVAIALLSAVAALLLKLEKREDDLTDSTNSLVTRLQQTETALASSADGYRSLAFEYPDLTPFIESASQVDVVAGLALNISNQYHGRWREALGRGLQLRLLCPDPSDSAVVSHSLFRSVFRKSTDDVTGDVQAQISFASALEDAGGELEISTIPYLPPFGMVRFSGHGLDDVIFVKLMAYKVGAGEYPVFRVTRSQSPSWYAYFEKQINLYFAAAQSVLDSQPSG